MSDPIDRLRMPASAVADLARAVPDDLVKAIVGDHYRRAAPTPPAPKNIVDTLLEKFGPKADRAKRPPKFSQPSITLWPWYWAAIIDAAA